MNKRLGYEVTWEYWGKNWDAESYHKAVKILGPEAADFICQSHPQPPDLFVVDRRKRFFFVEVKLPGDRLNKKQIAFNLLSHGALH
jgi:VRR-NUC domain